MWFSGFFFSFCLSVEVYLWWKLQVSHLFKWENLRNWWLTKYFFAPLYHSSVNLLNCNYFATMAYLFTPFAHTVYRLFFPTVLLTACLFIPCVTLLFVSHCFALSWPGCICKWELVLNWPSCLNIGEIKKIPCSNALKTCPFTLWMAHIHNPCLNCLKALKSSFNPSPPHLHWLKWI